MREMAEEHGPEMATPQRHLIESKVVQERMHVVFRPHEVESIYECVKGHDSHSNIAIWHPCD